MEQHDGPPGIESPEIRSRGAKKTLRTLGIVAIALIVLAAVGAAGFGLVTHPQFTAALRDLFIIVLALVTIVIGVLLMILVLQLQSLMTLLRDEIKPMLQSANQTVSTVRGTTTFVSNAVVTPMIQAASLAAAVRRTVKVFAGRSNHRPSGSAD